MEFSFAIEKNAILKIAGKCMDVEIITQTEKSKY